MFLKLFEGILLLPIEFFLQSKNVIFQTSISLAVELLPWYPSSLSPVKGLMSPSLRLPLVPPIMNPSRPTIDSLYLLQARADLSLNRPTQMTAPLTCHRISLQSRDPWPWHSISWWGWGACTRCPSPAPTHFSIFASQMRLKWHHFIACIRLLLVELHRVSNENPKLSDHP